MRSLKFSENSENCTSVVWTQEMLDILLLPRYSVSSITSMKIITDLSETYHSNAEESLANHNDLKSYRRLTHCFSSHIKIHNK